MKLIGENLGSDLSALPSYETYFKEGDVGELRLYLSEPLSDSTIRQLEDNICSQGTILTKPITQDARILVIGFQKAIAPLLIIVGAVAAIGAGILGWQVFQTVKMGVPVWVWLLGGTALLYLLLEKPVKKAAPVAIQAGKVYVTRKMAK